MKLKLYTLTFITVNTLLFACKSATKLYEKGNYDEAVEVAVKKIQKKTDDADMKALLQDAYRSASGEHQDRITGYLNSKNDLKWEWVYNEYASLQKLYEVIHGSPEATGIIQPADYSSYLATYKEKAGDAHYERGLKWMNYNDRESYKKAYTEFNAALRFKPDDIEIQQKSKESYNAAVVNVVVLPVNRSGDYRFSSYQSNNFESEVMRNLQYNINNEFVKFYSRFDADSRNMEPDQVIEMRFNNLDIGRVRDESKTREVSKSVVIKETVYSKDSVVKEYSKVYAKITTTCRTMLSTGSLNINIADARGQRLWNDNVQSTHQWTTEFYTYTGDTRALSDEDKKLVNYKKENPPAEDVIVEAITRQLNTNLLNRVRDYYSRY